jgi:5-methylcytosine-specific restriction protein A
MARTVKEWIGKTDNSNPPKSCQLRILDRQDNCCALTGARFCPGDVIEFDHITPLWLGGENREKNLQAITGASHKKKTQVEATVRAKTNRQKSKHLGLSKKKRPMAGSKASKWKRKMDGTVVKRSET